MRIAIVLPDLRGGGAERVQLDLAKEFKQLGHEVEFVLLAAHGEFLKEAQAEFSVVDLGCQRFRQTPRGLIGYLRSRKPQAVLAVMWPLTSLVPICGKLALPSGRVVVSEHGMIDNQYKRRGLLHRGSLRASTAVGYRLAHQRVGVSRGVVADMARLSALSQEKFRVIHNPVPSPKEPSHEELTAAEHVWNGPRGARVVTVGALKKVKNQQLLIRAFATLNLPHKKLVLVGEGAERQELERLAAQLGLSEAVVFAGFQENPAAFYSTADVFALTSHTEGFGNVLVESLACGTPVVSTDCPSGPREILADGRFGKLVPVDDSPAFAAALREVLGAPQEPDAFRRRAADFRPRIAAQAYLDLLV